jgi:kinesin family protein 5
MKLTFGNKISEDKKRKLSKQMKSLQNSDIFDKIPKQKAIQDRTNSTNRLDILKNQSSPTEQKNINLDEKIFSNRMSLQSPKKSLQSVQSSPKLQLRSSLRSFNNYRKETVNDPKLDSNGVLSTINEREDSRRTIQLKVAARFRPLNMLEEEILRNSKDNKDSKPYEILSDKMISFKRLNDASIFTFDKVFDTHTNQQMVYEEIAKETVEDVLKGYNGTIFTYGQSGTGKTYTLYGSNINDPDLKGITPRTIDTIFDYIDEEKNSNSKFEIKFSFLEIYKENLYDLLNPDLDFNSNSGRTKLKIKEDSIKGIYVQNLTEEYISDLDEFFEILTEAEKYRVVSETILNKNSSRSHALIKLEITQKLPNGTEKKGILNLVDLAGSEKVSKTGAVGETLEEAKKINLSLSALGKVISALSSNESFVPYRDSKLTRILQDSLVGNFKSTLIVTCSPHAYNSDETFSSLCFAQRAKKIKTVIGVNIKKSPEELQLIIDRLKKELAQMKNELLQIVNGHLNLSRNSILTLPLCSNIFLTTENNKLNEKSENITEHSSSVTYEENDVIKIKEEEYNQLKQENEELKNENKNLKIQLQETIKKIKVSENKTFIDLENLVKYNINELKKLKEIEYDVSNENLKEEIEILKKLNTKENFQFNLLDNKKDDNSTIGKKLKTFLNEFKEISSNINSDLFYEKLSKLQNGGNNTISDITKNSIDSIISSYELIFSNSTLLMRRILDDFLQKKNLFEKDFSTKDESYIKNTIMNLSLLNISYEKIFKNFLNKIMVDLKKFCLANFLKNEELNKIDSICNLFENFIDYLNNIKYSIMSSDDCTSSKNIIISDALRQKGKYSGSNIVRPVIKSSFIRTAAARNKQATFKFEKVLNTEQSNESEEERLRDVREKLKPFTRSEIRNISLRRQKLTTESSKNDSNSVVNFDDIADNLIFASHDKNDLYKQSFYIPPNRNREFYTSFLKKEDNTLLIIRNELNLQINYNEILKKEIAKLKYVNNQLEITINQMNEQFSFNQEIDIFSKCVTVLKKLYEEELISRNTKIELLSNTIDEILLK